MNEPPKISPITDIKLSNLNCFEHQNKKIVGICNDSNCKLKNKYMCVDCMFENHSGHKGIKSDLLEENYINKLNLALSAEKNLNFELQKFKENLRIKIDTIKNKVNNFLEQLYQIVLKDIYENANVKSY